MNGELLACLSPFLIVAAGLSFLWLADLAKATPGLRRARIAACALQLILSLLSWLWIPWLCYGVSTLYAWNIGKINDLSKPVQVLPPTPAVRPSAADHPVQP